MFSAVNPDAAPTLAFTNNPRPDSAPPQSRQFARTTARWLRREPMLHFMAAGALIFFIAHAIEQARATAEKTIVIDASLQQRLSKLHELQLGAAPAPAQLTQLVHNYVHDEVLYREARALGLDAGDEIIRRRLVQKMGFLQNDLTIVAEPDEQALQQYYLLHATEFVEPARVSFQQVFFSADTTGADAAYRRAERAREQLNTGAATFAVGADRSPLAAQYQNLDQHELERLFGAAPIVAQLLNANTDGWVGPLHSGYGWHLIKIDERSERSTLSFDAAREQIVTAVKAEQKELANQRNFRQLLARYRVQISGAQAQAAQP